MALDNISTNIVKSSIESEVLKSARVIPSNTEDNRKLLEKYRPISLLTTATNVHVLTKKPIL